MAEHRTSEQRTSSRGFEQTAFARLVAGTGGRLVRVVAGLALIGLGLGVITGAIGVIVAAIGLVPIAAGAFDVCILGPLFKAPFRGQDIRAAGR